MTIIAAEAAPAATAEAESAVAARGARAAGRAPSARPRGRPAARPSTGGRAARRPETAGDLAAASATGGYERARGQRNHGKRSSPFATGTSHHKIIAAEFFAAIAIVTIEPLISPGAPSSKGGTGPSPYGRPELVRIGGVMTIFFILALVSHGRPGKMAAAFGALVDLGVLFRASQRGALTGLGSVFKASGGTGSGGGTGSASGTVTV